MKDKLLKNVRTRFFLTTQNLTPQNFPKMFCATIFCLLKISIRYFRMTCNIANRLSLFKKIPENIE